MKPALLLAAFAALLIPLAALAAADDSLVEVFATGVGTTQEAANKAANKAAVEQVVGTMVDATTRIENDELVENRILTYSAALIADSKIVGAPKSAGGLITVKVKATVKKTALREKLVAAKLVSVELDGDSLWAQMVSAQDNLADAEAMIKDVLAKHLACVVAEPVPGKTGKSPLDLDPKTGKVFANVRVKIDSAKYRQFAKEVVDKLGPMAEKSITLQGTDRQGNPYSGTGDIAFGIVKQGTTEFGIVVLDNPKTGKATALFFDSNRWDSINECLQTGSVAISIALMGKNGDELAVRTTPCDNRDDLSSQLNWKTGISVFGFNGRYDRNMGLIAPFFGGVFFAGWEENKLKYYTDSSVQGASDSVKSLRIELGSFSPEELKAAGKLDIKVGHMKDGQFVE